MRRCEDCRYPAPSGLCRRCAAWSYADVLVVCLLTMLCTPVFWMALCELIRSAAR